MGQVYSRSGDIAMDKTEVGGTLYSQSLCSNEGNEDNKQNR